MAINTDSTLSLLARRMLSRTASEHHYLHGETAFLSQFINGS